jgi:TonB family protein
MKVIRNIILFSIIFLFSANLYCQNRSEHLAKVYSQRTYEIELLALLTPNFNKQLIPPKLIISEDSLISLIKYPEIAKRAGVKGIVIAEFNVDSLGEVNSIEIISGLGAGCDENVISTLDELKFHPALLNNKHVLNKMRASINFKIRNRANK